MSDAVDTAISDDMVDATVELNLCSGYLIPPARKQQPRTSKIFERIEPSMLACTMRISPFFNATMLTYSNVSRTLTVDQSRLTISSTALPKVALRSPPRVWPSFTESSSVAKLRSDARGIIARKFRMKTVVGFAWVAPKTMPSGTNTNRTLTGLLARVRQVT